MDTAIRSGCTCITCRLVFASVELQKQHYSAEWHRYNVKRQIAELPPVTEEQFETKIKAYQEAEPESDKKKRKSKKQQLQAKKSSDEEMEEEVEQEDDEDDYDEKNAINETTCLFCSTSSASFDDNLMHMSKNHGFFVPDSAYCCDIEGLVKYLGLKVGAGNYCIQCPNKRFRDLPSCQLHMRDKAHCNFSVEGDKVVEYLDFYDYGELLKDGEEDGEGDEAIAYGYSLILPSGATLGHRALMRYYKQKLRPEKPTLATSGAKRLQNNQLKALGWTGSTGPMAVQRARDFKYMKNIIKKNALRQGQHLNKMFKSRGRDDQQ